MSTKKEAGVTAAIQRGRALARVVVARRARQRTKRAAALRTPRAEALAEKRRRAPAARRIPAKTMAALGPREAAGLLIAEGDSWFDYPLHDVLSMLEDDH